MTDVQRATNVESDQSTAGELQALQALQAQLLARRDVLDCAVLQRVDRSGDRAVVVYVVSQGAIGLDEMRGCALDANVAMPDAVVRVSNIPLTHDGRVDESALARLPVIDALAAERYRDRVAATLGVTSADASVEWLRPGEQMLSVDEILPRGALAAGAVARSAARATPHTNGAPSLSRGEPIAWGAERPRQLSDLLGRAAKLHPVNSVTCLDEANEQTLTYPQLRDRAERIMAGLRGAGVRPQDVVIFEIDHNADFIAAFWGCMLGGFVPAPISVPVIADPASAPATKLKNAWHLLGEPWVLTTTRVEESLRRMQEALDLPNLRMLTVEQMAQAPAGATRHRAEPDDLALLLLTSGSTGRPKAVTQTHAALISHATAVQQRHGFTAADVSLNWFPLDHVGGIVMFHLRDVGIGCSQVHVRTDYVLQDVLRWLDLVERFRVTITWAPNFAFGLVNDRSGDVAARRWDLSTLAFILNGGEAVVASTARRFLKQLRVHGLPETAMRPSWGMSETCSAATFPPPFTLEATSDGDEFVEVGTPNPEFEIRILDDEHRVVPEGIEGHLEVRGPTVTKGYLNNPDVNAAAFAPDGWFRTGDRGRLVAGSLTITGRDKGEIIVNGVNFPAHEVEAAVEDLAGVIPSFTAAFGVREPGADTDSLAVAFHTNCESDAEVADVLRRIRQSVLDRVGVAPRYMLRVAPHEIPKTAIGKIQRPALTKRFADGGFADAVARSEQLTKRAETIPDWFFRPVWRKRASLAASSVGPECVVLIIPDQAGIAGHLAACARVAGARVETVSAATIAAAVADVAVDERLIVLLGEPYGARPDAASGDEPAMAARLAARVAEITRGIASSRRGSASTELFLYDDSAQYVADGDRAVVGKSSVVGMLRTIPSEHAAISVRHIDLSSGAADTLAAELFAELSDRRDEIEVAYRHGVRWVRRLRKQAPVATGRMSGLARNGFYVLTGGLGGVGVEVARHLLRVGDTPLLLIGRRALTDAEDERTASLAALEALGTVRFEAVDVADAGALERVVARAAKDWERPLAGVIHLAGVYEPRLVADETAETLAAALRPKVEGGWAVHRLLLEHPDAVLLAFSSVFVYLGSYTASAYATANGFLDSLVEHHVHELGRDAYSLGWALWDSLGMSRGHASKEAAARRGYHAMSAHQGIVSLAAVAGAESGQVLIGLDGSNPSIRRYVDDAPLSERVSVSVRRESAGTSPGSVAFDDRFGVAIPMVVRDADADMASATSADSGFGSELERAIAAVWHEVLPTQHISPNENFFDAGGTSLLVATVSRKMQEALGREIKMTDIYHFPTLRLLAAHYAGDSTIDAANLDESEERGKARRAQRLERRRRAP